MVILEEMTKNLDNWKWRDFERNYGVILPKSLPRGKGVGKDW